MVTRRGWSFEDAKKSEYSVSFGSREVRYIQLGSLKLLLNRVHFVGGGNCMPMSTFDELRKGTLVVISSAS